MLYTASGQPYRILEPITMLEEEDQTSGTEVQTNYLQEMTGFQKDLETRMIDKDITDVIQIQGSSLNASLAKV